MAKREAPILTLGDYLPEGAFPLVFDYLKRYHVHLTITRNRKTVLGDYRHAFGSKNHRISVNGGLNKYSFLITLVHELAHLITYIEFGNMVQPHGRQWKQIFATMMKPFLGQQIFPADIKHALEHSLHNLPAASCSDEGLTRVLNKYDTRRPGFMMVEEVKEGDFFATDDNKLFRKGTQLRKRIQCLEVNTGKVFLFSPVYEVKLITG